MTMQAYLDSITAKTGTTLEQIIASARAKGLLEPGVKTQAIVTWLGDEFGLGRGQAMAIVSMIKKQTGRETSSDEKIARHFAGKKAGWRPVYDKLVQAVATFGSDTDVAPGASYLSLRRAGKKFAILQVTTNRLDVGIKLKAIPASSRVEAAGSWNAMVTHARASTALKSWITNCSSGSSWPTPGSDPLNRDMPDTPIREESPCEGSTQHCSSVSTGLSRTRTAGIRRTTTTR